MSADSAPEYLTARELAELLRVRERKVYDLAAAGEVPCSRVTGKLLFPRTEITRWLTTTQAGSAGAIDVERTGVFAGSHDPLLEWALRESGAGLASFFDGSLDGLERFVRREAIATGLHLASTRLTFVRAEADEDPGARYEWNVAFVEERCADDAVVLVAFARRERGLIVAADDSRAPKDMASLRGASFARRQEGAGSQVLFELMIKEQGFSATDLGETEIARTESDAALAVLEGRVDAAFGLASLARQFGLGFVPLVQERFDLLVDRRHWFEPGLQCLDRFCRSTRFKEKAVSLGGYDVSCYGEVRFNPAR